MDIIRPEYNQELDLKKPWFKRPMFFILIIIAIATINNRFPFSKMFANVFDITHQEKRIADPNPAPKPEKDRLDVLILGIRGEDDIENGGLLTDTMLVLSIDKATKKAAMISIPRDLYLDNFVANGPNGKQIKLTGKLNEVYERGLIKKDGINFSKQVISKITGIYIDNVVVFDFNAFNTIVEVLGGVDVHLDKPFIEAGQWGYPFSLPAGDNHLNGDQALYYARSRFSTNDFDRARRQQEIIVAIKNKALALGYASDPFKATSLYSSLKGAIKTDFQIWDIKSLLFLASSMNQKLPVKDYFITTENLLRETKTASGEYILLPKEENFAGIKKFFANILLGV